MYPHEFDPVDVHAHRSTQVTRLKDFGDVSKLAKSDQYFSQIMTIPRLAERLECMLYRRKLGSHFEASISFSCDCRIEIARGGRICVALFLSSLVKGQ